MHSVLAKLGEEGAFVKATEKAGYDNPDIIILVYIRSLDIFGFSPNMLKIHHYLLTDTPATQPMYRWRNVYRILHVILIS